jgi:hypothetical protein
LSITLYKHEFEELELGRLTMDGRTLLTSSAGLEHAKELLTKYKQGEIQSMTPELWKAKKIVDSTLHPGMISSINV